MIYLIGQLAMWLILTAAFAAVAGWAFAAHRAAPAEHALQRERDNLLRDLLKLAAGDGPSRPAEAEREVDAMRRQMQLREGRVVELERALDSARGRVDALAGEAAALQRRVEELETEANAAAQSAITVGAEPAAEKAEPDEVALQAWRLRYFEQRVRYLESQARSAAAPPPTPIDDWRAREAEARAGYLAQEVRRLADAGAPAREPAQEEREAFAADASVDALLRWRMLYLERRLAHVQAKAAAPSQLAESTGEPDAERWKWRTRYLEARLRHWEQQRAAAPAPADEMETVAEPEPWQEEAAPLSAVAPRKPPVLAAARDGAPDDLTLIEGVSPMQRSTLYALGVFHFDQIGDWTPEHVAWVEQYLRLGGRIGEEEWVEQAQRLAREGPAAARRIVEEAL